MPSTTAAKSAPTPRAGLPWRPALAVAFWLAVWQMVALAVHNDVLLASPSQVAARLAELVATGPFWSTAATTLARIAAGFTGAAVVGMVFAVAASASATVRTLLAPPMATVRAVPVVSFIILLLLWVGSGQLAAATSFLMALPVL